MALVPRAVELALGLGVALAVLLGSACVHAPPATADASPCDAAAEIGDRGECMLAQAQALEATLEAEEARMLLALQRFEAAASGDADTGTGRSLSEEFRRAQQAWREYKDAECSYAYATAFGGPIRGLNAATCLRELYQRRIERVRAAHDALDTMLRGESDPP